MVLSLLTPASVRERFLLGASALVLMGGHLAFGGLTAEAALFAAAGWALILVAAAWTTDWVSRQALRSLIVPGASFILVMTLGAASLGNVIPGASQPIWLQLGLAPAATLDRSETLLEIVKLAGLGCVFLVGWTMGLTDGGGLRAMKTITYVSAAFLVIAISLDLLDMGPKTQAGRLEGMFLNPNTAGAAAGVTLCLGAGLLARAWRAFDTGSNRLGVIGPALAVSLATIALVMSQSRGALAATGVAVVFLFGVLAWMRRWRPRQFLAAACVAGAGAAVVLIAGDAVTRLSTVGADASLRRFIFDTHWQAFTQSPVLGYGLGSFDTVNRIRLSPDSYSSLWNIRAAQNVYLQWLVEGGLLMAAAMFTAVGAVLAMTVRQVRRRRSMLAPLLALVAVDLVFLVHGLFDFALQTYSMAIVWSLILGLQLSWSGVSSQRQAY